MTFFSKAVIYTPRTDYVHLFKMELKAFEVSQAETATSPESCVEFIVKNKGALLILDWQVGVNEACTVLESVQNQIKIEQNPTLIFCNNEVEGLTGLALEYGVSYCYQGEVTGNIVKGAFKHIMKNESLTPALRERLTLAADAKRRGDQGHATQVITALYQENPENERVILEYGECLVQGGKFEEAHTILEPLATAEEPNVRALNLYGRCLMKQGKFDDATAILQKADFINPFNVDRLLHLGDAYLHIQKIDRAKGCFEKATDIAPDNEGGKKGMGKAMLLAGDDLNEALALIKQLSGPREMASVFNGAAILSMLHGKFGEGMKLYGIALKSIGDDLSVSSKLAFNMGIGFHRKKQIAEASKCFQIALMLDPHNQKAKEYLATLPEQPEEELPDNPEGLISLLLRMV